MPGQCRRKLGSGSDRARAAETVRPRMERVGAQNQPDSKPARARSGNDFDFIIVRHFEELRFKEEQPTREMNILGSSLKTPCPATRQTGLFSRLPSKCTNVRTLACQCRQSGAVTVMTGKVTKIKRVSVVKQRSWSKQDRSVTRCKNGTD